MTLEEMTRKYMEDNGYNSLRNKAESCCCDLIDLFDCSPSCLTGPHNCTFGIRKTARSNKNPLGYDVSKKPCKHTRRSKKKLESDENTEDAKQQQATKVP